MVTDGGHLERHFKNFAGGLALVTVFVAVTALTACQLNTQEEVPKDPPLKLSGPTENCFGESLKTFENYFQGLSKPKEIDDAFVCVSGALELFSKYGRGSANNESFSSIELRAFMERHFLGSLKLNDTLLTEVMRLKQVLLGGALDRMTKIEIARLIEVLETLRIEAQRLRPYIEILSQDEDLAAPRSVDASILEQALSDFTFTLDTIGSLMGDSKQPYALENLKILLLELQALYNGRSNWKGPDWFAKQMPLIAAAKAALVRPQGDTVQPGEWRLLLADVGRIYGLFLRFKYAIQNRDMFYGDGLAQIEIGVHQVSALLEDAIDAKGSGRIDMALLLEVCDALGKTDAFKLPIQASTIAGLLEPFLERILNPVVIDSVRGPKFDPSDARSAKGFRRDQGGLTKENLKLLREAVLGWIEMQQLWERLEKEAVRKNPSLSGKPIPILTVRALWKTYSAHSQEAWSDLKSLLERPLPLAVHPDGRLMLVPTKSIAIDRNSFSGLNWKQQIIRTLSYGYVSDPRALRMVGITRNQLKEVFDDFWQLTLDLGFLDKTDGDIWKTGFTISNIFLFSSNGDERLSFHEAVDLFVFSFASSVISKEKVRADVHKNCELLELDPAGLPKIRTACWRTWFRSGYQKNFSTIPGWTAIARTWNNDSWNEFFGHMEKASRKPYNPSGPLMSSEMDRVVSIHHYIEAVYTRWDLNRDGRLSMAEADKAFFLFRKILREASGFTKDEEVRALYFYLLTFGKPPESFGNKLYWLWWKKTPEEWEKRVSADRAMLAQIFGNLAASL